MPVAATAAPQRAPRRARYLIPQGTPRRREILAALALQTVLVGLLFAQVTLGLVIAFHAVGKASRWPPSWLAVPAVCGLVWVLAIGPAGALTGFTAASRVAVALLAGVAADPIRLFRLGGVSGGTGHWLPGQFPVGLVLAAGVAAVWWWLDWLHTDEWGLPVPRPGLVSLCRRRWTAALVRSGGVLTREGACLGVAQASGRPAAVSWREAERGVLIAGSAGTAVPDSAFQFVHAAIRRRKPVIAVDLAGTQGLAASLAVICTATGAPMQVFGAAGTGYYEPLRGGDPARRAALVMGMIDWGEAPDSARMGCQACLTDLFAVATAAPGDPGGAVLDDMAALLRPGALPGRLERVPSYHPRRAALAERARVTVSRLEADPALGAFVADQLTSLRASALGRWLGPGQPSAPGARISLAEVVRQRGVVLFALDRPAHGRAADMVANLVARDAADIYAGLLRAAVAGDGLAWFSRCESVDPQALAGLVGVGADAGLAAVLSTTSPAAAGRIADQVNVLVLHRLDDPALADRLGWLTGRRLVPAARMSAARMPAGHAAVAAGWPERGTVLGGPEARLADVSPAAPSAPPGTAWSPAVAGDALRALGDDEFTLVTREAAGRVVPRALLVPAQIPRRRPAHAPSGAQPPVSRLPAAGQWPPSVSPPASPWPSSPLPPSAPPPPFSPQPPRTSPLGRLLRRGRPR
jgi:hypothetical protein